MIGFEYNNYKSGQGKRVIDAWKEYLNIFNRPSPVPQDQLPSLTMESHRLFINLLFEMSQFLGHDYSRTDLEKSNYSPNAIGARDLDFATINHGLADIFRGEKALPVTMVPQKPAKSNKLNLVKLLDCRGPCRASQ